jgi:TPR repeat protein
MFFPNMRAYRGTRLRLTLPVCLLLAVGLGSVDARVRAQPAQAIEAAPMVSAPIRLQGPDDPAVDREIQRLKSLAGTPVQALPKSRTKGAAAQKAASANAAQAAWLLGLIYLHGAGVARDLNQAQIWFERAQALGEPWSSAGLAWCKIEGCKGSPDPAGARRWIGQLRSVNLPRAEYLEWVVESRLSPLQIATPQPGQADSSPALPARELLVRAARGGDVHARIELGLESVTAGRLTDALAYFRAAAPKSAAATVNTIIVSDRIKGSTPSRPATMSAAELLASAQRFHRGTGQPANYAEAIRLYRLADAKGSVEARRMLALIYARPGPDGQLDVNWMQQLANLDLSKDATGLYAGTGARLLQREPTPLFDLLPEVWRQRSHPITR